MTEAITYQIRQPNFKMKNLTVTIYSLSENNQVESRTFLAQSVDQMRKWLSTKVDLKTIENSCSILENQLSHPEIFPNVLLFLDKNGKTVSIDLFMSIR